METKRRQLAAIVGEDNVLDDPKILEEFSHDESFCEPLRPWFVVRPATESEVQALVKWANSTATPLVPVSSGAPHFHGDTVPTATEAVIVDLSRMKAIKRIDRRNKMAVIEPGVTYSELTPALAKEGLRIPRPLLPRRTSRWLPACSSASRRRFRDSIFHCRSRCGIAAWCGEPARWPSPAKPATGR